jgi:U3 small nucleolar RNA-associated protein 6
VSGGLNFEIVICIDEFLFYLEIPPGPATISDYALVRRQFHIFERAVNKFKSDVGLWVQYIEVAKREKADALVGRIIARWVLICRQHVVAYCGDRALQLHPQESGLYIMGAAHELDQMSATGARTLLQRGIRINGDSMDLWKEYVKMEMGFIERLRRRWEVLGVEIEDEEVMSGRIVETVITNGVEGEYFVFYCSVF